MNDISKRFLVKRKCNYCEKCFLGVHNKMLCDDCIKSGIKKHKFSCEHCNNLFMSNSKNAKYCQECINNNVWKLKKNISLEKLKQRGESITKSLIKFHKSEHGKFNAKKLGKINSEKLKKYFQTEKGKLQIRSSAIKQSKKMKQLIADGKFTPTITNSWTHWDAKIILSDGKIKKFRSSWEAAFWNSNKHLEYETVRIPYIDKNNKKRNYIPDFYDKDNNIVYEIKPTVHYNQQRWKISQAIDFCLKNNLKFIWINENNLLEYINEEDFKIEENIEQYKKVLDGIKNKKYS